MAEALLPSTAGVAREGFAKEGTSEQQRPGKIRAWPQDIWGNDALSRGGSKCKGPEAGTCLFCSKNSKEASVAGTE